MWYHTDSDIRLRQLQIIIENVIK